MSSVFLSHNSKDKPWVRELARKLTSDGVLVWLDEAELNIGDSLIEKISAGISDMKYVAAVISKNSIESNWVQKEISLAMSKELSGRRVTVLPLLIDRCTLPSSLADKLYADFTQKENYEFEYSKLLRALGGHSSSQSTTTEIQQTNFKKSQFSERKVEKAPTVDIRIIGVVKERTRQDQEFSGLQHYYLQLSSRPPSGWGAYFTQARQFPRHSMWRDAWLDGDCVVVKCALDELSRHHVKDLKEDVASSNANYNQAQINLERKRQQEREQQEIETKKRNDALDQLNFD